MTQLDPISSDWLALREHADDRARTVTTTDLLPPLVRSLDAEATSAGGVPVLCIDLGTGTGANPRWLMPRLPLAQTWLLVDHDEALLTELRERLSGLNVPWEPVASDVAHLGAVLAMHRQPGQPVLVTCAALLDLLDSATVEDLAAILRDAGAHGLFSLTVDGTGTLDPAGPLDDAVQAAFNDHQQRHGHLGPDGVPALQRALGDGVTSTVHVTVRQTDWQVDAADPADRALIERLLRDRAAAVAEQVRRDGTDLTEEPQEPDRTAPTTSAALTPQDVEAWRDDRLVAARDGALRLRVGHRDVLVMPSA
ncbi:class I SAM-dependent methyltransferase [Tersicoccus sp. MR15.9]|uniref:class I SAM-dependent methyltransferase n=1 Tax=Tersicoccus mangrovi TaxID=3121635 RepID=UPI002FE508AE